MLVELLQKWTPAQLRSFFRPYHRLFFPNKIYGYWNITYRCTYQCSYCPFCSITKYSELYPKSSEKTPDEWLAILEKLPPMSFLLIGGEPLLYPGLSEVINNLPKKHSIIGLISNASLPVELYRKIKKKVCLTLSYHREFAKEDEFIEKVLELNEFMWINSVNIVATPENIPFLEELHKRLNPKGVTIRVEHLIKPGFQYTDEQYKQIEKYLTHDRDFRKKNDFYEAQICKSCSAGRNYINIMPNADVYSCVGGMEYIHAQHRQNYVKCPRIIDRYKMGNLADDDFKFNRTNKDCPLPCIYVCDWDYAEIKKRVK
ncbi:MAG: radical SAM protein [Clostridium sp.]|nr:radical SAM protein [Clostridium sp.]